MTDILKLVGNVPMANTQDIQNAAADKASYRFNNNSINMAGLGAGYTGNFTALITFSQKSYGMLYNVGGVSAADAYIYSNASGLAFTNGNGIGHPSTTGIFSITNGVIYTAAGVYDGSSRKLYMNGNLAYSDAQTALSLSSNLSSLGRDVLGTTSTFSGSVYRNILFNYALSEDKVRRYSAGAKLDYEDVGGSMNILTNGNFNVDTAGWGTTHNALSSVAGGQSGNCLQISDNITQSSFRTDLDVKAGKTYKVSGYFKIVSGSITRGKCISDTRSDCAFDTGYISPTVGVWTPFSVQFTAGSSGAVTIQLIADFTGSGVAQWDEITVAQLGAVLDLEPENITDGTWFDASPNGLHGTVTGALANRFIPSYSSRNYIINGGMDFWQRGDSVICAVSKYTADRWFLFMGGTPDNSTVSKQTYNDYLGSFAARITGKGTASSLIFSSPLETTNSLQFRNKTITIGCWLKKSAGFTNNVSISTRTQTGVENTTCNSAGAIDTVKTILNSELSTSNFSYFTMTHKVPSDITQIRFALFITSTVANNEYIEIRNVALNEDPVAAPFERAGGSIGGELALCQRYYEKSFPIDIAPANGVDAVSFSTDRGLFSSSSHNTTATHIKFVIPKRVPPIVTRYGNNSGFWLGASFSNFNGPTVNTSLVDFEALQQEVGGMGRLVGHWTADAEL